MDLNIDDKKELKGILGSVTMSDVFSPAAVESILEAIKEDEKDRLEVEYREDYFDNEPNVLLYRSLTENLQEQFRTMDALKYSFYAYELSMADFLKEFGDYIDCGLQNVENEYEAFIDKIENSNVSIHLDNAFETEKSAGLLDKMTSIENGMSKSNDVSIKDTPDLER